MAKLFEYAAQQKYGTLEEISKETGIPMGASSGKMPAILNYALGMGLITLEETANRSAKKPIFTNFGHIVYDEDPYMSEALTQWIAHFNLCRSDIGAKMWYQLFSRSSDILGSSFTKEQLYQYFSDNLGINAKGIGPIINTYTDISALGNAGVLTIKDDNIKRNEAPILDYYTLAYSAQVLDFIETYFPENTQVTLEDFNNKTFWFNICFWGYSDIERAMQLLEGSQYIAIDRQMKPWIIEKMASSQEVWPKIYDKLP